MNKKAFVFKNPVKLILWILFLVIAIVSLYALLKYGGVI